MDKQAALAVGVFLIAYGLIMSEKIHRTIVAMAGGMLVVILGVVNQETAIHHIDFNTLGLLIGMMIIVAITADTGIFKYIALLAAKKVKGNPIKLMVALGLITAAASALLDNVTTVLLMIPVTLSITKQLKIKPEPFLFTQIMTANIGGTATLIGDPPNIMIGSAVKELGFMAFINNLAIISVLILVITIALLVFLYRKQVTTTPELKAKLLELDEKEALKDIRLLRRCLFVLFLTITGFFVHQTFHLQSATIALSGACLLLLLTSKSDHNLEHIFSRVEWTTIFFFTGLFVLVGGLVETGVMSLLAHQLILLTGGNLTAASILILWLSAIASAFVDNIPFVATMIPLIQDMGNGGISNLEPLWWSLALGACLGGNGTLIGASANLIVAGLAAHEGHHISFIRFLKVGFPLMLLSIVISNIYIYFRYLM